MDKSLLNNFIQYLVNLGLISYESSYQLNTIYEDILSKENNVEFITLMYNSLLNFINNMNEEQKKFLSYNVIQKYLKIRFLEKINKLKSIFNILVGNQKVLLLKILLKWSNKNKFISIHKKNNFNTNIKNTKSKIEFNLIEANIKYYNKTKNKKLETFIIKKEEKGKPKLNKRKKINSLPNHNYPIFEGLNEFTKEYNNNKMKYKKDYSLNNQSKFSDLSDITFRKNISKDKQKKINNKKNIHLIKLRKKQIRKKNNLSEDYKNKNPKISTTTNNKLNNYLHSLMNNDDKNDNLNNTIQNCLKKYYKNNNNINIVNYNSYKMKNYNISKSCDNEKSIDIDISLKNKSFNNTNYDSSYISTQSITNKADFLSQIQSNKKNKRNKKQKINKSLEIENDNSIEKFSPIEREEIVKKIMDKLYSKKDDN